MCGRFALYTPGTDLSGLFKVELPGSVEPRYNIAPGQDILCIRMDPSCERSAFTPRWGFLPSWADSPRFPNAPINARSEELLERRMFKQAAESRRCLVPADGFYEWKKTGSGKVPYFFRLDSGTPFAMAGIWENWNKGGDDPVHGGHVSSAAIITMDAAPPVDAIHSRMPCIVPREFYDMWLDCGSFPAPEALHAVVAGRVQRLKAYEVSPLVGNPSNDSPRCIEPVAAKQEQLF